MDVIEKTWKEGDIGESRYSLAIDAARIGIFERDIKTDAFVYSPLMAECFGLPGQLSILADASVNQYHLLRFKDNGIGFQPEEAANIFTIFMRLHRQVYKGNGIGLALCKRIVENHGGFITATGETGKGATFSVYLPFS